MAPATEAVLKAALALPWTDRILVIQQLLEALSRDSEAAAEQAFSAELDRRLADLERDPSIAIPLEVVVNGGL